MRTLPSMLTNFFVLSVIYYLFIHLFVCLLKNWLISEDIQKKDTENKKEVEGGGGRKTNDVDTITVTFHVLWPKYSML